MHKILGFIFLVVYAMSIETKVGHYLHAKKHRPLKEGGISVLDTDTSWTRIHNTLFFLYP